MKKHGKNVQLRVLGFQSLIALFLSVTLALVAQFAGEKSDLVFPFLFAGLIGVAAHQAITSVMKRVEELESRSEGP